jgi:hypothetical protein
MRKLLPGALVVIGLAVSANAAVLTFDNFDYPDGSLVPNGGWENHSGVVDTLLVSGGQAVVQHGTPSEDAHRSFTSVPGVIYYGLDFSVDDLGHAYTAASDHEYFAHLATNGFDFCARLDVVSPTSGGDFSVGIASDDSVADAIWPTDLTYGTTYRAIVKYDQDANQAELWIDALFETDASIQGDDQADPGDSVTRFSLRQSDSDENETVRVDGLVVGTSFGDVVAPVPEPASFLLLSLGALALARRR